jgi:hypothetical protein
MDANFAGINEQAKKGPPYNTRRFAYSRKLFQTVTIVVRVTRNLQAC